MKNLRLTHLAAMVAFTSAPLCAQEKPLTAEENEFFEAKIRPALIEHCHKCHSGDKDAKIKGGLQLDSKAGLLKGGSTGPGLVPGQPDRSLIIKAMRFTDPNLQMPPKDKLPDSVLADFENWVRMGAPDPRSGKAAAVLKTDEDLAKAKAHWAFKPVVKPEPPKPKAHLKAWIQNDIDLFILAKLEEKGLFPSPITDKWTLVRRAYFDLIGMPPTAKEAEDFINDQSKDAWPKLIDKLLASPHYGERWGRYWLDIARYADTRGGGNNNNMGDNRLLHAYTYRDWVVNAINDDMPYDKFLKYQIAADCMPNTETKNLAALGFITMNRGVNNQQERIDDRIDVVTRGTMSLSVYCARCHDHKFDPIPTKDYYSLYGVFDSSSDAVTKPLLQKVDDTPEYRDYLAKKVRVEADLESYRQNAVVTFVSEAKAKTIDYMLAVQAMNSGNTNYAIGQRADQQRFERITKLQFEVAGPWKRFLDKRAAPGGKMDPIFTPWADYAELTDKEFSTKSRVLAAKYFKDGEPLKGLNPIVAKAFSTPVSNMRMVAERYSKLFNDAEKAWVTAITADAKKKKEDDAAMLKKLSDPAQEQLRLVFYGQDSPVNINYTRLSGFDNNRIRNGEQQFTLLADRLDATHPGAPTRAMAVSDGTPRNAKVLIKGMPNNPGPEVPRQFIEVLNPDRKPFNSKTSGRAELAEEIASKKNPLTARVLVNRVWMNHFGGALVRTPTDFGVRADDPTHPELLNYLSAWVMENGWSLKALHKLVMTSATYMQGSDDRAKPLLSDPSNLYTWKMNRRRLDFEGFRDSLLAVSGQMDTTIGGRPVKITPDGANPLGYKENPLRRTIYGYIDRGNLASIYRTFDFANPEATAGMRFSSTVPQQALYLMNSPFVATLARGMVQRDEVKGKVDEEQRIEALYQLCFQRMPSALETKLGIRFLEAQSGLKSADQKPIWQAGYGQYNARTKQVSFYKLTNYVAAAQGGMMNNRMNQTPAGHYDGGARIPGVRLDKDGGTVGTVSVIRRFTSPVDTVVSIDGTIAQKSGLGDGVNGFIVHNRTGQLGSYTVSGGRGRADTKVAKVEIKKGDTIDFIVDNGGKGNTVGDAFEWAPTLRVSVTTTAGTGPAIATPFGGPMASGAPAMNAGQGMAMGGGQGANANVWSAAAGFQSPSAAAQKPLDTWEKYAQMLLLSNELSFVD